MTAELTSEQIVTNLLVSNEILRPMGDFSKPESDSNLGEFLADAERERKLRMKNSRYTFIDLDNNF